MQVIGESELHFYYESISDCWRVLQWIKQRGEKGKDIIKVLIRFFSELQDLL